ncbi:protein of unknown function [Candidatus Nitrosocosmicus franklandus]|uniref:Uncharacterized protein n=1 Tax=Candidatus Nitrosocosmicus franklandianus TaxID=1798806 RepID=A0A484IB88_9ARCH|nr:protein of unknown function [Candidatus Nitrosocosmicus franklandus]
MDNSTINKENYSIAFVQKKSNQLRLYLILMANHPKYHVLT